MNSESLAADQPHPLYSLNKISIKDKLSAGGKRLHNMVETSEGCLKPEVESKRANENEKSSVASRHISLHSRSQQLQKQASVAINLSKSMSANAS